MKVRDLDVINIKQELVQWTFNQIWFGYTPESIVKRLPGVLAIILKERNIRFDAGEKVKFKKTLCSLMLALHCLVNSN